MRWRLGFLALCVGVLCGCESTVVTSIVVDSPEPQAEISVVLVGEVADAVAARPELDGQLSRTFEARAGVPATRKVTEVDGVRALTLRANVPLARIAEASGLTGISALDVTGTTDASVSVSFTRPDELALALAELGDQSAARLAASSTFLELRITFPGGVDNVVSEVPYTQQGNTVTVRQPVSGYVPGTLVATGSTSGTTFPWTWIAAALIVAGAGGFIMRRRQT
jgi:hypothetical protein